MSRNTSDTSGARSGPEGEAPRGRLQDMARLARPRHWIKNSIVLLPVIFARRMAAPSAWGSAALAALAFCLGSGAVYSINDVLDRREDRAHPLKKNRPVASGRISPRVAVGEGAVLSMAALGVALAAAPGVAVVLLAYLLLQTVYSVGLKHVMILDVITIAVGFVLRASAGAVAIRVAVSPWLVVCAFTVCLFMGFCKRRTEVATLEGHGSPADHRRTLQGYTRELLLHLITLSAAVAIVSYLGYATSARTVEQFGTPYLAYTLPVVVYGICRFAMLSMEARYAGPTELMLRDRPFQVAVALWVGLAAAVVLWGAELQSWLPGPGW